MQRIDSPKNPTIKALARLKTRRERERKGLFLIEGTRELSRAAEADIPLQQLIYAPELTQAQGEALIAELSAGAGLLELSAAAFGQISMRQNPDGVLAVAEIRTRQPSDLALPTDALVLVIDGLEKPGNVGALLRTADAADVAAVFVSGSGTDLYNPNVIRASMGSLFSRPVVAAETSELIAYLQQRGFAIAAATPAGQDLYWDVALTGPVALVLGTEHSGLGDAWLGAATRQVVIPMRGLADSLNVSVSGALLIYEALRQRRQRG